VRNSKGQEGFLPAIVFLIPPPDRAAILASYRLRQDLMAAWKETMQTAKVIAKQLMATYYSAKNPKKVK
jgi:hypothetical protein